MGPELAKEYIRLLKERNHNRLRESRKDKDRLYLREEEVMEPYPTFYELMTGRKFIRSNKLMHDYLLEDCRRFYQEFLQPYISFYTDDYTDLEPEGPRKGADHLSISRWLLEDMAVDREVFEAMFCPTEDLPLLLGKASEGEEHVQFVAEQRLEKGL